MSEEIDTTLCYRLAGRAYKRPRTIYTMCGRVHHTYYTREPRLKTHIDCVECKDALVAFIAMYGKKAPTIRRYRAWRKIFELELRERQVPQ